jgi:hypothetical protein
MSGIIVANKDEVISISAPNVYGANFSMSVYSQADNSWVATNQPMTEYIDVFTPENQTVTVAALTGDSIIECSNATNFIINDVIQIKDHIYKIKEISGNIVTINNKLYEDINPGDIFNRVGNMSLYYITLNIESSGDYLIRAKESLYGLEITDSLKVVPKSVEDMYKDIKNLELAILGN